MAYLRKLPSGKWQATYRGADGRKHTKTDPLKKVVKDWAAEEETKVAQGRWRDPRQGRQTVGAWAGKWMAARVVEDSTRRTDVSTMKLHILPHWSDWKMFVITSLDVQAWIRRLQKDGVGPSAVQRAYNLFKSMMGDAVTAGVLAETPCRDIDRPATPPKLPAWFTRDEVDRIRAELDRRHRGHSVMVELMCMVGLRWGEAAAVTGGPGDWGNPIDWLRGRVRVIGVLDQGGRWKEYPKTTKSRGEVPLPPHVLELCGPLLEGRAPQSLLFRSPRSGSPLIASNWRTVWYRAIDRINAGKLPPVPRLDPHDCRHTAASWLVQDGVPLYEVQALLRHESIATTQRYAHLAPDAHARVEDSWRRVMAHQRRIGEQRKPVRGS